MTARSASSRVRRHHAPTKYKTKEELTSKLPQYTLSEAILYLFLSSFFYSIVAGRFVSHSAFIYRVSASLSTLVILVPRSISSTSRSILSFVYSNTIFTLTNFTKTTILSS